MSDTTIQRNAIRTLSNKSSKDISNSTEVKIVQRGQYYLAPFTLDHIDEVVESLSQENRRELKLLGHVDTRQAIHEMYECSECYIARKSNEKFLAVGGLWYNEDQEFPQLFAMFSDEIKKSFIAAARGSRMLVDFFDKTQPMMSMTILSDYEFMIDWAVWLGFEPVGITDSNSNTYVEFVRCNPNRKSVYDEPLRPVIH